MIQDPVLLGIETLISSQVLLPLGPCGRRVEVDSCRVFIIIIMEISTLNESVCLLYVVKA